MSFVLAVVVGMGSDVGIIVVSLAIVVRAPFGSLVVWLPIVLIISSTTLVEVDNEAVVGSVVVVDMMSRERSEVKGR